MSHLRNDQRKRPVVPRDDGETLLVAELFWARHEAEQDTLAAVLFEPAAGFAEALAAGVRARMFEPGLHRTTWLAMAAKDHLKAWTGEGRPRVGAAHPDAEAVLHLRRRRLVETGEWDHRQHPEAFAELALSHGFPASCDVRGCAGRLVAIATRIEALAELEARRRELLLGGGRWEAA